MKLLNKLKNATLGFASFITASASFATQSPCGTGGAKCNIGDLSAAVRGAYSNGVNIFYAVAAVIGVAFIIAGLFKAKAHSHDMQGQGGHLKGCLFFIFTGSLLVCIPLIMITIRSTTFGTDGSLNLPTEASALSPAS